MIPLQLCIPAWAEGASLTVNGEAVEGVRPNSFHEVEHTWKKGDVVELSFPMQPRVSRRHDDSIAVERGPLVYSPKIGGDYSRRRKRRFR